MSIGKSNAVKTKPLWWVYILKCSDKTLYCGVTVDVQRRVVEHNTDNKKGAKYTRVRRPVSVLFQSSFANRSLACKEEARIKKLSRKQKLELVDSVAHIV